MQSSLGELAASPLGGGEEVVRELQDVLVAIRRLPGFEEFGTGERLENLFSAPSRAFRSSMSIRPPLVRFSSSSPGIVKGTFRRSTFPRLPRRSSSCACSPVALTRKT
jgi:hypothetical protein